MQKEDFLDFSAEKLYKLFVSRSDLIAFQRPDGRYAGNVTLTQNQWDDYLKRHLSGKLTIGTYALNRQNQCKWLCLDIDCKHDIRQAENLARLLSFYLTEDLNIPHAIEYSGNKGYHLWIFMEKPTQAKKVRSFAKWFLGSFAKLAKKSECEYVYFDKDIETSVEIFPKQDQTNGLGSLIKLPAGKHRVTGNKSTFLLFSDKTINPELLDRFLHNEIPKKNNLATNTALNAQSPKTAGEWNVYRALLELCADGQTVKIPMKKLAEKTGFTRQTAAKWMHSLSNKNLLDINLKPTSTFTVFRPKYNRTTQLIKREYFISVKKFPNTNHINPNQNNYSPSFKVKAPYRKDTHPSLVYLPMIGIWKDYATGQIFNKKDPMLKNYSSMTIFSGGSL